MAGHAPYGEAGRPLSEWFSENGVGLEQQIERLGLGYKLHCLATRP
jgi:hypothetical protein